jgi:hypothetical protein
MSASSVGNPEDSQGDRTVGRVIHDRGDQHQSKEGTSDRGHDNRVTSTASPGSIIDIRDRSIGLRAR